MKSFGLFEKGNPETLRTFEGVLTVIEGKTVTIYDEPEPGKEGRTVVAEIRLTPGQSVHDLKIQQT
jgi:hypothetical protein